MTADPSAATGDRPGADPGAEVIARDAATVDRIVWEAELVDGDPPGGPPGAEAGCARDEVTRPRSRVPARAVAVITTLGGTGTAAVAGRAGRRAARAGWTTAQGVTSWGRRAGVAATHGHLREQVRLARVGGDRAALAEWAERLETAKTARTRRLLDLPKVVLGVLTVAGIAATVVLMLLVAGALYAQLSPGGTDWSGWWGTVGAVLAAVSAVAHLVVAVAPLVAGPALVALAWREGRRAANPPGWLLTPAERAGELVVDERAISAALAHLGIPAVNTYLKAGGVLEYVVAAHRDGDGVAATVRVPMGATAGEVADRRPRLAANLHRATLEVWPTVGDQAGLLDMWIGDPGLLGSGAGEWPLLHDGEADVFAGVPIGRSQRGTVIETPLFESNWLLGGRPGQGKSAAMRTLLLGAALDPSAELWVFVMGESPDFAPFRPRLSRYSMGMDDATALAALEALRAALAEMERRGKVLGGLPGTPPKVSRKLADRAGLGLHPLILSIDECHELFMHPKYGKEAADLAIRLIKRGRKYGVILVLATQSPTKDSIPREVTRNVSAGVAFAVADHVANDGLLGAGKYKAGVRATDLRMRTDRGTAVAVGVTDEVFELVRWFYVPFGDGEDAVTPVIARAVEAWRRPAAVAQPAQVEPAPDHLADVAAVLRGEQRVRTQVVLGRLAEHDPGTYEAWTPADLRALLVEHGAAPTKTGGLMVVRGPAVHAALDDRDDGADDEQRDADCP